MVKELDVDSLKCHCHISESLGGMYWKSGLQSTQNDDMNQKPSVYPQTLLCWSTHTHTHTL